MDTTSTLTATEVIDRVRTARTIAHDAAVEELQLAVQWALLHPCSEDSYPAGWGWTTLHEDGVIPLAGPGTPLVDHFAPASLGAALGITLDAARQLIADALELTYRLPRLWALVVAGLVPVWLARTISRETHDLSVEAVAFADRLICATPAKVRQVNAARLVDEARLWFDPDRATEDERHALEKRGVWHQPGRTPATTDVFMTLDTPDAELFDQTTEPDRQRARRPRRHRHPRHPQSPRRRDPRRPPARPRPALRRRGRLAEHHQPGGDREPLRPPHPRRPGSDTIGAVSIEKLGAATTDLLADWLARHTAVGGKVIVRPVLDLASERRGRPARPTRGDARTRHPARQPLRLPRLPPRLPDLRPRPHHPLCPDGRRRTTRPNTSSNLAPLCRSHHRLKTFTAWDYKRLDQTRQAPIPGPHPPDTSTRSPRRHGVHHHEEPDAPHPGPPQPGPPARPGPDRVVSTSSTSDDQGLRSASASSRN